VLPKMQFLQRAAVSLRSEQQQQPHHSRSRAGGHTHGGPLEPPVAPSGGSGGLHTVVELRGASVEGGGVEAAAAAARRAVASSQARNQAQQQQQGVDGGGRGPSFELRVTDVVLGNASLRQWVLGGQQQGHSGSAAGSPRVGATAGAQEGSEAGEVDYAEGFVPRSVRPMMGGAGHLASSGIKRRSANYS
jgi:hypothetical protein